MDALETAATVVEAMNAGEFERVPAFIDDEELDEWYSSFLPTEDTPSRPWTADDFRRQDPDMPKEAAEYYAARLERQSRERPAGSLHGEFAGLETKQDLARVSPPDALARFLRAQDPAWQLERRAEEMDAERPARIRALPVRRREVLGVVADGEERAHAVYRVRWFAAGEAVDDGEVEVVSLRHTGAGWRLRLRGELFAHGPTPVLTDVPGEEGSGGVGYWSAG